MGCQMEGLSASPFSLYAEAKRSNAGSNGAFEMLLAEAEHIHL
jgi:hypothetical protein